MLKGIGETVPCASHQICGCKEVKIHSLLNSAASKWLTSHTSRFTPQESVAVWASEIERSVEDMSLLPAENRNVIPRTHKTVFTFATQHLQHGRNGRFSGKQYSY